MKQISPDGDAGRTLVKIARKRIRSALRQLEARRLDDEAVHAARKSLKKARAGLRLLRPGIRKAHYRKANSALRDAARPLSAIRDAAVLADTLSALVAQRPAAQRSIQLDGLQRAITWQRTLIKHDVLDDPKQLAHSRRLLRRVRTRMTHWKLDDGDWPLLGSGLRRVYDLGRRARTMARNTGTPETLHEWRKQVKYLRYELEILIPLRPGPIGALARQARRLSDALGDSHDLSVLCEFSTAHPDAFRSPGKLDALLALAELRQRRLLQQATLLGSRLFLETPAVFAARFGRYWRDWHHAVLKA